MPLPTSKPAPIGTSAYYGKYSYSGADVRAYGYFPGHGELIAWLDSMHTVSYSIHEAKGDARSLGFRGVKGFSRGVRMIAGSIIMVVVQDNPFGPLMDQLAYLNAPTGGWSFDRDINGIGRALNDLDFTRRIASSLPPFNLLLQLAGEVNNWQIIAKEFQLTGLEGVGMDADLDPRLSNNQILTTGMYNQTIVDGAAVLLSGIDIIDEGTVVSVNDAYMEVSYSFKALDCKPISLQQFVSDGLREPRAEADPLALADIELASALWKAEHPDGSEKPFQMGEAFDRPGRTDMLTFDKK